jgi:hypothetical protein
MACWIEVGDEKSDITTKPLLHEGCAAETALMFDKSNRL